MKKLKLYLKILLSLLKKNVVTNKEYGESYDEAAETYQRWIGTMGKHVKILIHPEWFNENSKIVDLACGTGFISRELIKGGFKGDITGVDISSGMLKMCRDIESRRVRFVQKDGIEYLEQLAEMGEKVDGIFIGWAFPYLDQKRLLKVLGTVLKKDGYFMLISNCSGTLKNIERNILNVMADNIEMVEKPMEARIKLPENSEDLKKKIEKSGFTCLESGDGEEWKGFAEPDELYNWLMETGALAGVDKVFKDMNQAKPYLIEQIRENNIIDGSYKVNHKFAYGIFKRKGAGSHE